MLCAAGMAHSVGVAPEVSLEALRDFEGLPHRFERCGELGGVTFIDDSKATNAHAALAGLRGLEGPFVAIVGGVDKGLDLEAFAALLAARARAVILIGDLRERMARELSRAGARDEDVLAVESMEEAVAQGYHRAAPDAALVLSPACSSFDMFDSYAHRGDVFQEHVAALIARAQQR